MVVASVVRLFTETLAGARFAREYRPPAHGGEDDAMSKAWGGTDADDSDSDADTEPVTLQPVPHALASPGTVCRRLGHDRTRMDSSPPSRKPATSSITKGRQAIIRRHQPAALQQTATHTPATSTAQSVMTRHRHATSLGRRGSACPATSTAQSVTTRHRHATSLRRTGSACLVSRVPLVTVSRWGGQLQLVRSVRSVRSVRLVQSIRSVRLVQSVQLVVGAAKGARSRRSMAAAMRGPKRSGVQAKAGTPSSARAAALRWS